MRCLAVHDVCSSSRDNHDQVRFLNVQSDYSVSSYLLPDQPPPSNHIFLALAAQNYRNALLYLLLSEGIPIVYYGTEQVGIWGLQYNGYELM